MRRLITKLGVPRDFTAMGVTRAWGGLRRGDQRQLLLGLGLLAAGWLRRSGPGKKLIYRRELAPGSAVVVHNTRRGEPKIEVSKPAGRRRRRRAQTL